MLQSDLARQNTSKMVVYKADGLDTSLFRIGESCDTIEGHGLQDMLITLPMLHISWLSFTINSELYIRGSESRIQTQRITILTPIEMKGEGNMLQVEESLVTPNRRDDSDVYLRQVKLR